MLTHDRSQALHVNFLFISGDSHETSKVTSLLSNLKIIFHTVIYTVMYVFCFSVDLNALEIGSLGHFI